VLVTALNPALGYLKAAEVAKDAMARHVPIRQVVLEKGYLSPEELDRILDVHAMTEGGIMGAND
jgi:fumarate hydratase, class II